MFKSFKKSIILLLFILSPVCLASEEVDCEPGYFGDPFASPHGHCEQCSCYPRGTEQTDDGVNVCDQLTGNCHCKPNVIGKDCNECKNGYWNIASGNGCESCSCDPIGSYNSSCDTYTGQCFCKPGVTGEKCDKCQPYQYGFSTEGCKQCDCDPSGSKGFQCDENGQCPCNDNVEGRRCDRCKENKYDRHQGCIDCPHCYNLVQDAVNEHRAKLEALKNVLKDISNNPTVSDDEEFESKLKATQEKLNILLDDAKAGAGGGDLTLIEKVNELHDKLHNVRELLDSADQLQETANDQIDTAGQISVQIEKTILAANNELNNALELLETEGAQALQRAKDRSAQFDNQSKEISEISREARQYADQLEAEAKTAQDTARDALEKATKAFEIAKNTTNLQQLINADLKQNVSTEIQDFKTKIETVKRITDDALEKANEVYDEALTLFANVNALTIPDVDTGSIKADAKRLIEESDRILKELDEIVDSHAPLIKEIEENIELAKLLVNRAVGQKEEALRMLEDVEISNKKAEEAVKRGSKTLKEANYTYHTLTEFHDKVQQSKANAELALNTIGDIDNQIREAGDLVDQADKALEGARSDAENARRNAQEAQEKYAEQASKDADQIRRKANETKFSARDLRAEADNLNQRVGKTEERLGLLENSAQKEDALTKEAKDRVGQASADAIEAQKQVEKALKEVKAITDELENLRDIDVDDLNRLEAKLAAAEEELKRANLDERIATLNELKNNQNRMIKSYKDEILQLEAEVENIRTIAEALPDGCFKRVRLEP